MYNFLLFFAYCIAIFLLIFVLQYFGDYLLNQFPKKSYALTIIPFIAFITLPSFSFYFIPLFLFFSALTLTFFTDAKAQLISRWVTLFPIPLIWVATYFNYLPISFTESIISSIAWFSLMWLVGFVAKKLKGQEALGQGDMDLMAFIGACIGFLPAMYALVIGSILGSVCGVSYAFIKHKELSSLRIPFGSFIVIGAYISTLFFLYDILFVFDY